MFSTTRTPRKITKVTYLFADTEICCFSELHQGRVEHFRDTYFDKFVIYTYYCNRFSVFSPSSLLLFLTYQNGPIQRGSALWIQIILGGRRRIPESAFPAIAAIRIAPPTNVQRLAISPMKIHTQTGPSKTSVVLSNASSAAGTTLLPKV